MSDAQRLRESVAEHLHETGNALPCALYWARRLPDETQGKREIVEGLERVMVSRVYLKTALEKGTPR